MTLRHLSTTETRQSTSQDLSRVRTSEDLSRVQPLGPSSATQDVQATFCATLLDEWVRAGITRAVVSPGSRSTPMALALAADERIELHVVVDERSASFFALGMAKASGVATILLCTSGTAAVEYHPAVVEADLDHVPLIVCTADRPKELHGIGAPQTVNQQQLFGGSVRLFLDLPVAEFAVSDTWRSTAARIALAAGHSGQGAGPVQVNLGFREPLVGNAGVLPEGRANGAPWHQSGGMATGLAPVEVAQLAARLRGKRGIIVAGAGCGDALAVHALAAALGWPVLADARSGARVAQSETLVANADSILRNETWAEQNRPDVVLRLGAPWASKVVNQWLARTPDDVLVDPDFAWFDPNRASALHIAADPTALCNALIRVMTGIESAHTANSAMPSGSLDWLQAWRAAEVAASIVLADQLGNPAATASSTIAEPALARALVRGLPDGAALFVSSSMPIRDVEWFGGEHADLQILANRGANGIDGVLSTGFGVAAVHGGPTVCLIGDLAFLHDVGALSIAAQRRINATVVLVDNRGGGIFEFLPQATGVARDRFELLYGTEQHVNLADVARGFGLPVTEATTIDEALRAVNNPPSGVQVVLVHTNRQTNVSIHRELNAAIATAIDQPCG